MHISKILLKTCWLQIIKRLKSKYGDLYNERNVAISGTHTHSGPGGFHQYLLYDITSLGFVNETFVPLVEGIVAVWFFSFLSFYTHFNSKWELIGKFSFQIAINITYPKKWKKKLLLFSLDNKFIDIFIAIYISDILEHWQGP